VRWLALVSGIALVVIAVAAVTRVTDTREGLIAEIITLLGGLAGISLLIYGLAARPRPQSAPAGQPATVAPMRRRPRSTRDLGLGGAGLALALILLAGLTASGGWWWAAFGFALLLPMISGCLYLCVRYLRASP
jgi:hypothetical protein